MSINYIKMFRLSIKFGAAKINGKLCFSIFIISIILKLIAFN